MRVYADTSFIVKLLAREAGTEEALAQYRRLGRPALAFLPLHALEAENAIRAKAFHQRHSAGPHERSQISREEPVALERLSHFITRGVLVETNGDWDAACARAGDLSRRHTATTGARSLDLLHLAFALEFECELFLSTDECQAGIAASEGLEVLFVKD
jgi:predicted nucleic acid-binding protein